MDWADQSGQTQYGAAQDDRPVLSDRGTAQPDQHSERKKSAAQDDQIQSLNLTTVWEDQT